MNTALNLRSKILNLEELIRTLAVELNEHKKEVTVLRSEKETLESVVGMKTDDVRDALTKDNNAVCDEMKRHYEYQRQENANL